MKAQNSDDDRTELSKPNRIWELLKNSPRLLEFLHGQQRKEESNMKGSGLRSVVQLLICLQRTKFTFNHVIRPIH